MKSLVQRTVVVLQNWME